MKGLLVEDEPMLARMLVRVVQRAGASEVQHAEDVAAARPLVASAEFVISDWNLPDGTGAEVVRLAQEAGVPVLVCTSETWLTRARAGAEVVRKSDTQRVWDFVQEVRQRL